MALVPFQVSGAAASQDLECRQFQIGHHTLRLRQDPASSGHRRDSTASASLSGTSREHGQPAEIPDGQFANVGLVVWQSGFLLAEYLVRNPPFRQWADVKVIDLGSGTGIVGIALAMAGAQAVLTDLPHVTPLTQANAIENCPSCKVVDYKWGQAVDSLDMVPDVITGGDLIYDEECHSTLLDSLKQLALPHTLVYLSYRSRGHAEDGFQEKLQTSGFYVEQISPEDLHEEYRMPLSDSSETMLSYHILRAVRLSM